MGWIYIYTNRINGKKYIGQTINTVEDRYAKGCGYKNQVFGRALKKYGRENFDLISVEVRDENLDAIESALIEEFDTTNPKYGYNRASGGNKNKKMSEETKKKISESKTGKKRAPLSEEWKKNISESLKGNHNALGLHPSEETKQKMSESQKGEKNHFYGKHHSEETKRKIAEAHERFHYIIKSPSGEMFETNNLKAFCKEHGLDNSDMGKGKSKGWIALSKEEL